MENQETQHCPNCQTELKATEKFCSNCGQKQKELIIPLRSLLQELLGTIFNLDARLWKTLKTAFRQPGKLARDYNAGKRKRFVSPVQFYIFCSVLYFLLLGLYNRQNVKNEEKLIQAGMENLDTVPMNILAYRIVLTKEEFLKIAVSENEQIDSILATKNVPPSLINRVLVKQGVKILTNGTRELRTQLSSISSTGMFFLLPIFALLCFSFYYKIYPYYIQHLIFSVYLHGVAFLFLAASLMLNLIPFLPDLSFIFIGLIVLYAFLALKQFYQANWKRVTLSFLIIGLFYGVILLGFILVFIVLDLLMLEFF